MRPWFETVHDLHSGAEVLRARRYGVIEVVDEALRGIHLRPFPKVATVWEVWLARQTGLTRRCGNRCWLYYNQPRRYPWCLTLQYIVSDEGTTFSTLRRAAELLDEVAEIKDIDTLLCDVSNARISDRLLKRWGWQPHAAMTWHRNYVKRLYQLPSSQRPADTTGSPRLLAAQKVGL